jgi:hypothetical protein
MDVIFTFRYICSGAVLTTAVVAAPQRMHSIHGYSYVFLSRPCLLPNGLIFDYRDANWPSAYTQALGARCCNARRHAV